MSVSVASAVVESSIKVLILQRFFCGYLCL